MSIFAILQKIHQATLETFEMWKQLQQEDWEQTNYKKGGLLSSEGAAENNTAVLWVDNLTSI